MSTTATPLDVEVSPCERLEALHAEIGELTGQRNAIDARLVEIVAEIDGDGLWGATGARSITALVAWKTGVSPRNAEVMVAIAHRIEEFPRCAEAMREGRLSLDQVGVVAEHAADGSDEHYAQFAKSATVTQLRTAVKLEPRPEPEPKPEPQRSIKKTTHDDGSTTYTIRLPKLEAAKFDAAMASHQDALVADWKRDHENAEGEVPEQTPPFPNQVEGFMSLIEAGWDADVARRPHGQQTAVVVHLDLDHDKAILHLGSVLTDDERQLLLCDATCEVWLEKHGQPIGAGRSTRTISRRLRRALEHRDRCCRVPGCGATRGLHAHHIIHWENGGATELHNLVLVCPFHHRLHHKRVITITGPADRLVVTDAAGRQLQGGSLARPPTTPRPDVPPCPGPTGERAQWWWYQPFEPPPTPSPN
ncbi:HNH endonuclease signature motif containing protein [Mycolicibacterium mucogenicum]|uniref:HNH endonuclease n=1 Tax=Mycolicibacterium mucogenicum TaxID=56689 RepID=A0A4R5WJM5_MYCMU|nr:HNH endonuclease signature motif containing protein [Mycolicibacterium mucogenicum]TDK90675.1 HNH endonuclease [Mycolicibacterium mucogenicum]